MSNFKLVETPDGLDIVHSDEETNITTTQNIDQSELKELVYAFKPTFFVRKGPQAHLLSVAELAKQGASGEILYLTTKNGLIKRATQEDINTHSLEYQEFKLKHDKEKAQLEENMRALERNKLLAQSKHRDALSNERMPVKDDHKEFDEQEHSIANRLSEQGKENFAAIKDKASA